jgi:mono/diheme cytochrome c family protein
MTTNEIILAVVAAVLVVFSLTVALVVPKRNPDFPGRRMGVFFVFAVALVAGMLAAVEVIGGEEEEAEAGEVAPPEPSGEPAPPSEEPAPPAEEPGAPPAEEPPAQAGDPAAGKEVFVNVAGCGACHALADAGTSGAVGPNLDDSQPSYDLVIDRVTNGRGAMPSFGGSLSEEQIQDVAAYVVQATSG